MYRPVRPVPAGISRYWPVRPVRGRYGRCFYRYETQGLTVPDHRPVRYIPAVPAGTVRYQQHCSKLSLSLSLSLRIQTSMKMYYSEWHNQHLFVDLSHLNQIHSKYGPKFTPLAAWIRLCERISHLPWSQTNKQVNSIIPVYLKNTTSFIILFPRK